MQHWLMAVVSCWEPQASHFKSDEETSTKINIPVKVKQGYGEHAYNKLILKAKSVSYPLS